VCQSGNLPLKLTDDSSALLLVRFIPCFLLRGAHIAWPPFYAMAIFTCLLLAGAAFASAFT
jgi:hypothetical protein